MPAILFVTDSKVAPIWERAVAGQLLGHRSCVGSLGRTGHEMPEITAPEQHVAASSVVPILDLEDADLIKTAGRLCAVQMTSKFFELGSRGTWECRNNIMFFSPRIGDLGASGFQRCDGETLDGFLRGDPRAFDVVDGASLDCGDDAAYLGPISLRWE